MKKGFTLVEMLIVVVVIALMISMVPFRMQGLQSHTTFALSMNDREDYWQNTIIRMRQSNKYKQASIYLHTTGASVVYSGGVGSGIITEHFFPQDIALYLTGMAIWTVDAYGLSCLGYDSGFQFTFGKNSMCYRVDTNSCNLLKVSCKIQ